MMANPSSNYVESEATEQALFEQYVEYSRVYSVQEITEQGIYKEENLPEDYGGSVLQVEVVHAVYMVNRTGKMIKMEFDIPEAMDGEDKLGGPYRLDGEEIKAQSGESTVPTEMLTKNSNNMSEEFKKPAAYLKNNYDNWRYI